MSEIKAYPFCGARAIGPHLNADLWWISCTNCEADQSHGVRDAVIDAGMFGEVAALQTRPAA